MLLMENQLLLKLFLVLKLSDLDKKKLETSLFVWDMLMQKYTSVRNAQLQIVISLSLVIKKILPNAII